MKVYSTGFLSIITTIVALVANIQIKQGFNFEYPCIFYLGQCVFIIVIMCIIVHTLMHWEQVGNLTKKRLYISVVVTCLLYAIAWTGSSYAWILIFISGVTEAYLTRKRAGLVKKK